MRVFRSLAGVVAVVLACSLAVPAAAGTFQTRRVSVRSNGDEANDSAYNVDISADRRFVVFSTNATNLVNGDTNDSTDVFVHDRLTGRTRRVSVASNGDEGDGHSGEYAVAISANGRFVVFDSYATNLVNGDTNGFYDIFVRDLQEGRTRRVSLRSNGDQADGDSYESADISAGGRFVTFSSYATNLVGGDSNGFRDVFVRDRETGRTRRVSVRSNGDEADGDSGVYALAISANGRVVTFDSVATNLVGGDANGFSDVFAYDRDTGRTRRVSVASNGAEGDGDSQENADVSADGRFVAFSSDATNLVGVDSNGYTDVFVHDRETGRTRRVSVASNGDQGDGDSGFGTGGSPSMLGISADGRFVALVSKATNLVNGDSNGFMDVFVHDRETGRTRRVSVASGGAEGDGDSGITGAAITSDARFVAYNSAAANLVGGDTNGQYDTFVTGPLR